MFVRLSSLLLCVVWSQAANAGKFDTLTERRLSDDDQQFLNSLVDTMRQHRQQLISGQYVAKGTSIYKDRGPLGVLDGPIELFCAFDETKGVLRFDRSQPFREPAGDAGDVVEVQRSTSYIQTPEMQLWARSGSHLDPDAGTVRLLALGAERPAGVRPIHIAELGLTVVNDMIVGKSHDFTWDYLKNFQNAKLAREDNGIVLIEKLIEVPGETRQTQRIYKIDTENGYTPVMYEQRRRDAPDSRWSDVNSRAQFEWKEQNGVWVPVSIVLQALEPQGYRDESFLSLVWSKVNEPVDDSLFTRQAIEMSDGTRVFDHRLGEPVLLKVVNTKQPFVKRDLTAEADAEAGHNLFWLYLVNGIAIFVIVSALLLRRRQRVRTPPENSAS